MSLRIYEETDGDYDDDEFGGGGSNLNLNFRFGDGLGLGRKYNGTLDRQSARRRFGHVTVSDILTEELSPENLAAQYAADKWAFFDRARESLSQGVGRLGNVGLGIATKSADNLLEAAFYGGLDGGQGGMNAAAICGCEYRSPFASAASSEEILGNDLSAGVELGLLLATRGRTMRGSTSSQNTIISRVQALLIRYPRVLDPRTGRSIPFPSSGLALTAKGNRVNWDLVERGKYIAEWYRLGYATPKGGWSKYDIHHIQPRALGGNNTFWNRVPVERATHQTQFNKFWSGLKGL